MRSILVLAFLVLAGCATKQVPMEPSIFLLSTNKEPRWVLDQVSNELEKNRYEVESKDYNLGLLIMAPRKFIIIRGDERTFGTQSFQLRQEGASIKVRITYTCEYPDGVRPCTKSDQEANSKIKRVERLILSMLNRQLFKKPGEERIKSKEI